MGITDITIERSPDDARTRIIAVSAKGRRAVKSAVPLWEKTQAELAAALGDGELSALRARIQRVVALSNAE